MVLLGSMVGTDSIAPTTDTVMSASLLIEKTVLFTACAFCTWTKKTDLKNMQIKRQNEQRKRHAAAVDEHKKTVHDATRASPSSLGSLWPVARTDKRLRTRCHRCDTLTVSPGGAPDNTRHSQQLLRHGQKLKRQYYNLRRGVLTRADLTPFPGLHSPWAYVRSGMQNR